jgi:hypothetical protein
MPCSITDGPRHDDDWREPVLPPSNFSKPPKADWVDLKKHGLPNDEGDYLVVYSDGEMQVTRFEYGGEDDWLYPMNTVRITHWCALPRFPLEQSHENHLTEALRDIAMLKPQAE